MTDFPDISLPGANDAIRHQNGFAGSAAGTRVRPPVPPEPAAPAPTPPEPEPPPPDAPEPEQTVPPARPPAETVAAPAEATPSPAGEAAEPWEPLPEVPAPAGRLFVPAVTPPVAATVRRPVPARAPLPYPRRVRNLAGEQIRRLVLLAVTVVLLGIGGGLLGALVWTPTYAARAEILYPVGPPEPAVTMREDRELATQLVLLQGRAVLGPVARAQGRAVEDLDDDVTVSVLEASEVIQVEARAPSRESAMDTVQAVVDRYFTVHRSGRPTEVREYLDRELAIVRSSIADARGRLTQLQGEAAAGIGAPGAVTAADNELQTLLGREQDIRSQLDDLVVTSASGPGAQLLTPAYNVEDPVSPRPVVAAGSGAVIGVLVAAAAVALAARRWIRN